MSLYFHPGSHVLLTGATGFLGKVVLESLLKRRDELGISKILVLIRENGKGVHPEKRFINEVISSPCFSQLSKDWPRFVEVVPGELQENQCGIEPLVYRRLTEELTHIINCAASVEFDLPFSEAAKANITSTLHVLELAQLCNHLKSMVHVSTAYVSPHQASPIREELVPLPESASKLYKKLMEKSRNTADVLKATGHPNTYTLTKCLAEHFLLEKRDSLPLTIVRPSIISACWQNPFPGWIDSQAAFAGFVALIGGGYLRGVVAQYPTRLDVVPCDFVAYDIIEAGFNPPQNDIHDSRKMVPEKRGIRIRHSVAGFKNSLTIDACIRIIEDFFRRYPFARYPHLKYVGKKNIIFHLKNWQYHRLPGMFLKFFYKLTGAKKKRTKVERLLKQVEYLNHGFPYFTHNTFDFHSGHKRENISSMEKPFDAEKYIENVCRGVFRHLLKQNDREVLFGGKEFFSGKSSKKKGRRQKGDLVWALSQPHGNWAIRLAGYFVRKGLRAGFDRITYDKHSFEEALKQVSKGALLVIAPTHRSYLDFIICSSLFFTEPGLGIAIPHIAAAYEFSKIPFLGFLFRQMQAFYIKRGLGLKDDALSLKLADLAQKNRNGEKLSIEFFIEGTRSRSRKLLKPKTGILKCLKNTGETTFLLPVGITYDRLPEEKAFVKELKGGPKPAMRLTPLIEWLWKLWRGKIHLGQLHVCAGKPLRINPETDVSRFSDDVMASLERALAATTYHLDCFLLKNPDLDIDLSWLKQAIRERGFVVIDSPLMGNYLVDSITELSMRHHWIGAFFEEALYHYPQNPVIPFHISQMSYAFFESKPSLGRGLVPKDPLIPKILNHYFQTVLNHYALVCGFLSSHYNADGVCGDIQVSPKNVLSVHPEAFLPYLQEAFDYLESLQIVVRINQDAGGGEAFFSLGPQFAQIDGLRKKIFLDDGLRKVLFNEVDKEKFFNSPWKKAAGI